MHYGYSYIIESPINIFILLPYAHYLKQCDNGYAFERTYGGIF